MTGSDAWQPWHGTTHYEANKDTGQIRSFKRDPAGALMKLRPDGDDYLRFNYTDDAGVRHHNFSVARAVLLAHDPDGYRPGLHACHGPGGRQDNRLANLRWDTPDANREEALAVRLENSPPRPKPPKVCPRCGAEHTERGKNCRPCFEGIGVRFAQLLADGMPPEKAAEDVDYPPIAALNLAMRYGGLRFAVDAECIPAAATGTRSPGRAPHPAISPIVIDDEVNATARAIRHAASRQPWLRRVINRARASRQNSDAA